MKSDQQNQAFEWKRGQKTLRIEPWGKDAVRVRCTCEPEFRDTDWALVSPLSGELKRDSNDEDTILTNGNLQVRIAKTGWTRFYKTDQSETPLLEEQPHQFVRHFKSLGGGAYHVEQRFVAYQDEKLFGLGQDRDGLLDRKGSVVELYQSNTHVSIPFMVSDRGYGFLWNNPAVGRVELGQNRTKWVADETREIDYVVMTGESFTDIMQRYADVTGYPPMLPEFASGFWQCKLRYWNQEELLSVAREYKRRGLPLSVIVIDWFHWPRMGEWCLDPECWPDPDAMVRELKEMGVELMVSVWPTVNPQSSSYSEMKERGLLVRSERGYPIHKVMTDNNADSPVPLEFYDATNPEGRKYLWEKLRENYYQHGIRMFWLDCSEPEYGHKDFDHLRYYQGRGKEVTNFYSFCHCQGVSEGLDAEGESEKIMLTRGAWAGTQRWGAAVWSGDIPSTFATLQEQIVAGLNIALSGIPWWTTDIGGFSGGDITDPTFRELIVRWFQYGAFCPLFRLHGVRKPKPEDGGYAPNEIWSFGDEAYEIIKDYLFIRENLRPYVMAQMRRAHEKGTPPMRPLFFDFPSDSSSYTITDEFMFGPDILVAPVCEEGARSREVYMPEGVEWQDAWTGQGGFTGGQTIEVDAPLERIPLFIRPNAQVELKAGIDE